MKTIFLADGEKNVLDAVRLLLQQQELFEVVGEVQSAEALLAQVCKNPPDLILLDWSLPGIHHQRLIRALRECCPGTKLAALSAKLEHESLAKAYDLDGFISKLSPAEQVLEAVFRLIMDYEEPDANV